MPPRIPGVPRLGALNLCLRPSLSSTSTATTTAAPALPLLPLTQKASLSQREKKRIAKQDPYRWAQMQQRKAAHNTIKERLTAERQAAFGDPVRGLQTPFIESFDSAGQAPLSTPRVDSDGNPIEEPHALPTSPHILNFLVSRQELEDAIHHAYMLTKPMPPVEGAQEAGSSSSNSTSSATGSKNSQQTTAELEEAHERSHATAVEALRRIVDLNNGSNADRKHANIRRCVETFGRHVTETTLRPKALARGVEAVERPVRGGPDTGSSEVQIAILTTKIRALANALEVNRGYKDKVGKRDLRLLVHRRQRLLRYMERRERGSDRWHHLLQTLGLSPATWKGQITL